MNKVKSLCRSKEFIEKIAKSSFWKKTKTGVYLVDAVLSLESAYDKDNMMDNLLSSAGGCLGTGPGFAVSAFIALGNDFWDRFEHDFDEMLMEACGLTWNMICETEDESNILKYPYYVPLLFTYKKEKDEPYSNSQIAATSIRIKYAKKAYEIFGFTPAFVNYYMANDPGHVCRTRYFEIN